MSKTDPPAHRKRPLALGKPSGSLLVSTHPNIIFTLHNADADLNVQTAPFPPFRCSRGIATVEPGK